MDNWRQYFEVLIRPGPPIAEDEFAVNKRIIEGYCSYQSGSHGRASIRKLAMYLPDRIHVFSPTRKEALDFANSIGKSVMHITHVADLHSIQGHKPKAVIFLGDFSSVTAWSGCPRGYTEVSEYVKMIQSRYDFPIWHIGEWRFGDD